MEFRNKFKSLIILGGAILAFNLAPSFVTRGYAENLNYTPVSVQEKGELAKKHIAQAKRYNAQGFYGNSLLCYLKAKQYGVPDFIVSSKIKGLRKKIEGTDISYGVSVAPFNNYSSDAEIPGLIASNLTKDLLNRYGLEVKMARSVDEAFNSDASLIITGDVHSFNIGESQKIVEKTKKYQSGSERILRREYSETLSDLEIACLAYERERERSDERQSSGWTDIGVGVLKEAFGVSGRDNFIRGGAKIGTDALFSSEEEYRRECEGLKEKRSNIDKYEERPIYSYFTYRETTVTREGKLRISLRLVEKGTNKVLYNQTLEDHVKDSDMTRPEFLEAGVYGDPLKVASGFELGERLIENIIGKVSSALEDSLEAYKPIFLIKKAKEFRMNGNKKKAIEYYVRGLQGEELDSVDMGEAVNFLNAQGGLSLSGSEWRNLLD
jgi:TolB-like protein